MSAYSRAVPLAEIKQDARLAEMVLVKQGRLSIQPVMEGEWKYLLKLGGRV